MKTRPTDRQADILSDHLRSVPLFQSLPRESDRCFALIRQGTIERHPAGTKLAERGAAPELLVVLQGSLTVEGADRPLSQGDHYGEIDLILDRAASRDVATAHMATVFHLGRDPFLGLLDDCNHIVRNLLRSMASRHVAANSEDAAPASSPRSNNDVLPPPSRAVSRLNDPQAKG